MRIARLFTNFIAVSFILCSCTQVNAQQELNFPADKVAVKAPIINDDNSVTFWLYAPKATVVNVAGDFSAHELPMIKSDDGMWQVKTPVLGPDLYTYRYIVDGVTVVDPKNVHILRDVTTLSNIFIIDGDYSTNYKIKDVPHGTVSKVWYHSDKLDADRRMSVYLPAGYESSGQQYPVLYLLHGMGGDENSWLESGRAAQILDNLIAAGKAAPMIVVMTNGNVSMSAAPGETSAGLIQPEFELPRTMDGAFEEHFPDVVNFVDSHYRTKADKAHRAIAGLSMGGYHAMHISKEYPDMFDFIGLFSAATFDGKPDQSTVYDAPADKFKAQFAANPELYWIAIGSDDFLYQVNKALREVFDSHQYPYTYTESSGGHTWHNWRIYLSEFLPLLFRQ